MGDGGRGVFVGTCGAVVADGLLVALAEDDGADPVRAGVMDPVCSSSVWIVLFPLRLCHLHGAASPDRIRFGSGLALHQGSKVMGTVGRGGMNALFPTAVQADLRFAGSGNIASDTGRPS